MTEEKDFYTKAHLIVAAVRLIEHRDSVPPSMEKVAEMLGYSIEQVNILCKKLTDFSILEIVEGAYGTRLFIRDHRKLEDMPVTAPTSTLEDEIQKFKSSQKDFSKKIESMQAEREKKKKDLFSEIESKLKKDIDSRKTKK